LQALGTTPRACRVALLGAGGAAAAVLAAVEQWDGAEVVLYNRTRERAERMASRFPVVARVADTPDDAVRGAAVVVNATSIGLSGGALPIPVEALDDGSVVLDLVYRRGGTPWVRAACARGLRAQVGLAMLLEQGALAFERWFGVDAPRTIMRDAVR
jgi:shikimate dehydrogenase